MILIFLMYALFASAFTIGKVTLSVSSPFFLTGIRMMAAGLILLAFLIVSNRRSLLIARKYWPHILFLGIFNVFITNGFEFWGLQFLDTGETSLIYSFCPLFAIILSYFMFKERPAWRGWLGIGIGMLGFILIFKTPGQNWQPPSIAQIAVTIGAFTAVMGWMMMKRLMKDNISFLTANTYSFLIGGSLSLFTSLLFETQPRFVSGSLFWFGMLYIAIIHNVICYNLYGYSLKRFSVSFMTFAGFTAPLFTALYGRLFLNEKLTSTFFLSLTLIVIGVYFFSKDKPVQQHEN